MLRIQQVDNNPPMVRNVVHTWYPGSVHPYCSLWMTIMRYVVLNRPVTGVLHSCISARAPNSANQFFLNSRVSWPQHSFIDIDFFVHELGESLGALRWGNIGDFPFGMQSLFSAGNRICISCMTQAYHTVLFSLSFFDRCPVHNDPLLDACPNCGRHFSHRITPRRAAKWSICGCNQQWISEAQARVPPVDLKRDQILGDLVNWLETTASRCWTFVPSTVEGDFSEEALIDLVCARSKHMGNICPDWFLGGKEHNPLSEQNDRAQLEITSGLRVHDLSRVASSGSWRFLSTEGQSSRYIFPVFKSIRRYVLNHVLGNRTHLLVWVGLYRRKAEILEAMQHDPYIRVAWKLLYWLQISHWADICARQWLLRILGLPGSMPRRISPTSHWPRSAKWHIVDYPGNLLSLWLANWINSSISMDAWPSDEEMEIDLEMRYSKKSPEWRPGREKLTWWAGLSSDDFLQFGVYRRTPSMDWAPAKRAAEKAVRRKNWVVAQDAKATTLQGVMESGGFRLLDDGSWEYVRPATFVCTGKVCRGRLLMGDGRRHWFGVCRFRQPGSSTEQQWLVKHLDLPVYVLSSSIGTGLSQLKTAARAYETNPPCVAV